MGGGGPSSGRLGNGMHGKEDGPAVPADGTAKEKAAPPLVDEFSDGDIDLGRRAGTQLLV
jgi:hypothetical protein